MLHLSVMQIFRSIGKYLYIDINQKHVKYMLSLNRGCVKHVKHAFVEWFLCKPIESAFPYLNSSKTS